MSNCLRSSSVATSLLVKVLYLMHLSTVQFPAKDNLCTRFATELILRRSKTKNATVAIMPGRERTERREDQAPRFQRPEREH